MINFNKIYFLLVAAAAVLFFSCEEETIDDQTFGTLKGKVVSIGLNTPLENVKITTNPSSNTVFTDSDGNFVIDDVSVGEYSVQAEKNDFQTAFEPANILSGKTTNIVFEMDSTISSNLQPMVPLLLFPTDKQENVSSPVEFVWSSSANDSDEITYTLELRNGNTGETQVFNSLMDTVLTVDNLGIGANFFWQVTADDEITASVQSKISSFQMRGVEGNRFLYVRNVEGNNVIFSGGEPLGGNSDEVNQNEVQLTTSINNSYRPKSNRNIGRVAFIRNNGGDSHIFSMNLDGTEKQQITNEIPIVGFRQDEIEFSWYNNGGAIYYPNFNKLYSVNNDGSGTKLIYEAANGVFISKIAVNPNNGQVAIITNDSQGYNAEIKILNPSTGQVLRTVVSGFSGALGGLDYSLDGNKILYTRDISGVENNQYRQLDTRIFEYNLTNDTVFEIDTQKPTGFNNLDAKYSPNGGFIIYTFTSNDGISEKRIFRKQLDVIEELDNELLFTDAFMPFWE